MSQTAFDKNIAADAAAPACDVDVLIVGLGPVGAALANLLGRYGVRVLAIDKATEIFMKPRAIALDNEALRILQLVGVRDGEFSTVAIPQVQYHSPLFGRFARINSTRIVDGHPMLVTFYQPELEQLLRAKLAQLLTVRVQLGMTLEKLFDDGRQVKALLRGANGAQQEVRARYLVGADGANSLVRRLLGLEFEGRTFRSGLAHRRRPRRTESDRPLRVHLRSTPADAAHGCARRTPALGVHAEARRAARGHGAAGIGAPSARTLV